MPRSISSVLTFPMKYLFPPLMITSIGYVTLSLWLDPASVVSTGTPGSGPSDPRLEFLAIWLLLSAFALWQATLLKRVRLEGGALLVSNYWREIRVPLTEVLRVTQKRWLNPGLIIVQFRVATPLGKRITFMPRSRFRLALWREDPLVGELRGLAGLSSPAR